MNENDNSKWKPSNEMLHIDDESRNLDSAEDELAMELNRITAEGRNTQEAKFFHDRELRIPNPYNPYSVHSKSKSSLEKPLVP